MKTFKFASPFLLVLLGIFNLSLLSCDPESETIPSQASPTITQDNTTETPTQTAPKSEPKITPSSDKQEHKPEPIKVIKKAPVSNTKDLQWEHYSNEDWLIMVVNHTNNPSKDLTYYGCDQGRKNCLMLTDGIEKCETNVCFLDWHNGNYLYRLSLAEGDNKLQVKEGDKQILESDGLKWSDPTLYKSDSDQIPNDREDVAGISEAELATLLVKIQKAVLAEDWQTLADLSMDPITVKLTNEEKGNPIPQNKLVSTLKKENLKQWKIRIMTQTLDDLFLNQYGAMIGQGSIWIGKKDSESAKIMTISIW